MEKFKSININVVLVSVVALIITFIGYNTGEKTTRINVDGNCSKTVTKDKFTISVNIKNIADDSAKAVNKSLNTYKLISNKLNILQSETKDSLIIGTSDYSIYDKTEYNHKTGKEIKLGVVSSIGLQIATNSNEALISLLELLKSYKDVYTSDFSNVISNATLKQVREECLTEAINDAKNKAQNIAKSLNKKLGKVIHFYERNDYMNYKSMIGNSVLYKGLTDNYSEKESKPSIFSGSGNVNLNVSVTFELL